MRDANELEDVLRKASQAIDDGAKLMGEGYRKILPAVSEFAHHAYSSGGEGSVDDLMIFLGQERIKTDICSLLVAVGMGDVLVASQGGKYWKPEPGFAARVEAVVNAGHHTATRGKQPANADPLSGYLHPGVKVHKR